MSTTMSFSANKELRQALERYCEDHGGITMSAVIKDAVAEKLIKENYLQKGGS